MKKISLLMLAMGCSFSTWAANDVALGLGFDKGLSAVGELDNTYRLTLGNHGGALDALLKQGRFGGNVPLNWYAGVGGYAEWNHDHHHDDAGVRVPLGVKATLGKGWRAYAQLHPELNLKSDVELNLGGALGVTYSF